MVRRLSLLTHAHVQRRARRAPQCWARSCAAVALRCRWSGLVRWLRCAAAQLQRQRPRRLPTTALRCVALPGVCSCCCAATAAARQSARTLTADPWSQANIAGRVAAFSFALRRTCAAAATACANASADGASMQQRMKCAADAALLLLPC